jgi:hypothetical protein
MIFIFDTINQIELLFHKAAFIFVFLLAETLIILIHNIILHLTRNRVALSNNLVGPLAI